MEDLVWADVRAFLENPGVVLERLRSEGIDTDSSLNELETRRDDLTKRLAAKTPKRIATSGHTHKVTSRRKSWPTI
jgi:hypothetical protein